MEKLLKVEQIAELLQVSKRTIYDWTHIGYIPHYKFPNKLRFKKIEIEKWLNEKRIIGRNSYKINVNEL